MNVFPEKRNCNIKSRPNVSCSVLGEHDESSRMAVSTYLGVRAFVRSASHVKVVVASLLGLLKSITSHAVRGACGEGLSLYVSWLFVRARTPTFAERAQSPSSRCHAARHTSFPFGSCSVYSPAARGSATRSGSRVGEPSVQFGLKSGGSGGIARRHRRTTRHPWDRANTGGRRAVSRVVGVRWGWLLRRARRAGSRSRDRHRRRNYSPIGIGEVVWVIVSARFRTMPYREVAGRQGVQYSSSGS